MSSEIDDVEYEPESDLFLPLPGRAANDFPGRFLDYCQSRGLDPNIAAFEGEVHISPEVERAVKARLALRRLLNEGK